MGIGAIFLGDAGGLGHVEGVLGCSVAQSIRTPCACHARKAAHAAGNSNSFKPLTNHRAPAPQAPVARVTPRRRRAILSPMNTQARPTRPATYQDVLDAPPYMVAEIANGRLHLHPRPALRHPGASFGMAGQPRRPVRRGTAAPAAGTSPSSPSSTSAPTSSSPTSPAGAASACRSSPTPPPPTSPPTGSAISSSPRTRSFDLTEKRDLYRPTPSPTSGSSTPTPAPSRPSPSPPAPGPSPRRSATATNPRRAVRGAGVSAERALAGLTPQAALIYILNCL